VVLPHRRRPHRRRGRPLRRRDARPDGGLIVAVRNQQLDRGKPSEYTQGVIWEMDRSGHLVRKFKPAQFNHIAGGSCNPAVLQLPLGIYNAVVSPNGKYVAYTAHKYVQSASCSAVEGYSSWIANIDGSGARMIADTGGNTASLEIGHFTADSSRLLVDRADFGSIETYYVNLPGSTAQPWTGAAPDEDAGLTAEPYAWPAAVVAGQA
jgi:hypothetical protein